jgi:hypothetical protein
VAYLGPLRRLTAEEVDREVRDITTRTWPQNSVLCVKNFYDRRTGCIFRTYDGGPETIQPTVVFPHDDPVAYSSLKGMVEAGWVVD